MKNFKVDNTIELASELTQLRKNHPQNGKVISKERLSLAMDKGRTWLSQVETQRLKKVDSTDIVKLYSLILDVDIQAAEEKFLEFYEPYIEDLKKFDSVLNKFTVSIKERYSASKTYKEHRDLSLFIQNIYSNFINNCEDFEYLLDGLDLSLLNTVPKWTRLSILDKMNSLKDDVYYLKKENILKSLACETSNIYISFNDKNDGIFNGFKIFYIGLNLLNKLLFFYQENNNLPDEKDLDIINNFSEAINAYTAFYFSRFTTSDISKLTALSFDALCQLYTDLKKHYYILDKAPIWNELSSTHNEVPYFKSEQDD